MRELLEVATRGLSRVTIRSDEHTAYPRAMRGLDCEITHRRINSKVRRDRHNLLFEINSLDGFIRHCSANHRRETIAFSKRRQAASERLAVFAVWKNFRKRRWEKRCRKTPAMEAGIADRVWTEADILRKRLFPSRVVLPERWKDYYWRRVQTVALAVNRQHRAVYAV